MPAVAIDGFYYFHDALTLFLLLVREVSSRCGEQRIAQMYDLLLVQMDETTRVARWAGSGRARFHSPDDRWMKRPLLRLLTSASGLKRQPQGDVSRLHRLRNHPHQVVVQCL
jgi:hypothetical protein